MLFNSIAYFIFLPIVLFIFFIIPQKWRWLWLFIVSCYFYAYFIPVYLFILFFIIIIDYFAGINIEKQQGKIRKTLLIVSLGANISVLAFFKYYNFLNDNITIVLQYLGYKNSIPPLNWVLPIGLSFHTFQAMSYTIDVYNKQQKAEQHLGYYALYVMYFPQLVAGPIEKATRLIPQLKAKHFFSYERCLSGSRLIIWGLFKKVVIGDTLGAYIQTVFSDLHNYTGLSLLICCFFYVYQVYCDFSGYTDIAIGSSKILGINLMTNFNKPFNARTYPELWSRWHISLTTWFREYLYIPLGGNKVSKKRWYINILIVYIVMGVWHGSAWTCVGFGLFHGLINIFSVHTKDYRFKLEQKLKLNKFPLLNKTIDRLLVFCLFALAAIILRCPTLNDFVYLATHIFTFSTSNINWESLTYILILISIFEAIQSFQKDEDKEPFTNMPNLFLRFTVYLFLIYSIILFGNKQAESFIYFQF